MHVQNHHFVHTHFQTAFLYTLACILLSDLDRPACTSGVAFPYQSNNENEKHIFDFAHLQDAQQCIYIQYIIGIYIYICTYCIPIYRYTLHIYTYTHINIYTYIHIMYTYIHIYIHTCTHIYIYTLRNLWGYVIPTPISGEPCPKLPCQLLFLFDLKMPLPPSLGHADIVIG